MTAPARRVHLLRHAKSSWDDPALADAERPLAPRGRRAARRLAEWIAEHEVRPGLVVCSPAVRTRETLAVVLEALGTPPVEIDQRLYHASAAALLARLHELPDAQTEVLLVGHNPGLADLCAALARPGPLRDRVAEKLPTGALATLEADAAAWAGLAPGTAVLGGLVLPRELG